MVVCFVHIRHHVHSEEFGNGQDLGRQLGGRMAHRILELESRLVYKRYHG